MSTTIMGKAVKTRGIERMAAGRKLGVLLAMAASLLTALLLSPLVKWFTFTDPQTLYQSLKLKASAIERLHASYSLFDLLSFVEISKMGILGLYAMLLMLAATAALLFHAVFFLKGLLGRYGSRGLLGLYGLGRWAMLFSLVTALGAIGFPFYANHFFGMPGLAVTGMAYFVPIAALAGQVLLSRMNRREMALRREHGLWVELKRNWILFVFLIPCFVYFLINNYLPMAGIYFAFTQFNFRDGLFASPYIGLKNFEFLVKADLWNLTKNTLLYNLVFIGLGNVLQVFFAVLVSQTAAKWFKKTSQTLIFMPYFVSYVILKVLVYNVFEYDFGLINSALVAAGGQKIDFYNNSSLWPFFITFFYLWKNLGYGMVVYLATITGISDEYYDAAKVDGANVFQQVRYITLPLLKPTFIILLLYALGGIMKGQFELFYQLVGTNGVLFGTTDIFDTFVYRITMTQPLNMGYGTAAGLYQSVFGFAVILTTNWLIKRKNPEHALF